MNQRFIEVPVLNGFAYGFLPTFLLWGVILRPVKKLLQVLTDPTGEVINWHSGRNLSSQSLTTKNSRKLQVYMKTSCFKHLRPLVLLTFLLLSLHRRRLKTEQKAKVVAVGCGTELNTALSSKDDLNKRFWKNIHFGRVVVWYGVNRMVTHFPNASVLPSSRYLHSSFFSSWWKIVSTARNWINSVPKQQRRPLPSLLSLSFL